VEKPDRPTDFKGASLDHLQVDVPPTNEQVIKAINSGIVGKEGRPEVPEEWNEYNLDYNPDTTQSIKVVRKQINKLIRWAKWAEKKLEKR